MWRSDQQGKRPVCAMQAAQKAPAAARLYPAWRARYMLTVREDYPDHQDFGCGACLSILPPDRARVFTEGERSAKVRGSTHLRLRGVRP